MKKQSHPALCARGYVRASCPRVGHTGTPPPPPTCSTVGSIDGAGVWGEDHKRQPGPERLSGHPADTGGGLDGPYGRIRPSRGREAGCPSTAYGGSVATLAAR
eukprot:7385411-Prymnesium_polylepis.1